MGCISAKKRAVDAVKIGQADTDFDRLDQQRVSKEESKVERYD